MRLFALVFCFAACGRIRFDELNHGGADSAGSDANTGGDANTGTTRFATGFGGSGNDEGYALAVAADGTVLMTGTFSTTFSFGSSLVTSNGADDVFVAAFEPDGTPRWVRTFGSTASDRGQAVAVDANGQIYVCGLFGGPTNFGGQMRTPVGMWDIYVISYDAAGTQRWVQTAGDIGADFAYDIAIDPASNVLVAGYYQGPVDFGAGALPAYGGRDAFVAKYTSTGTLVWAHGFGSAADDSAQGVAADAANNVVIAGDLGGPVDFGTGPKGAALGSFVAKLDAGGTTTWANGLASVVTWDVDVHRPTGTILIASRNLNGADVGSGPLPPPIGGTSDGLVAAFSADGTLAWHREFGGSLDDLVLRIATDPAGNAYGIGLGGADLMFGGNVITGNGGQDIFVAAFAPGGTPSWARMFGGTMQDRGYGVAVAPDGGLYISGRYAVSADFGRGTVPSTGGDDIFLAKLQ